MHRTRNAAYGQPYRGFESLPLRQKTCIWPEISSFGGSSPKWSPIALKTFRKLLVSSMGQATYRLPWKLYPDGPPRGTRSGAGWGPNTAESSCKYLQNM